MPLRCIMTDVDSKRGEPRRSIARYHRDYEKQGEREREREREEERENILRLREGQGVVKRRERKVKEDRVEGSAGREKSK